MSAEETPVEIMPSMQLLAEAAQEQEKLPEHEPEAEDDDDEDEDDVDDRSSSLSELEDRAATDGSDLPEVDASEGDDEGQEGENEEEEEEEEGEARDEEEAEDVDVDVDEGRNHTTVLEDEEEEEDAIDTEAETEVLQESPEKRRPSRALHLRASDILQIPEDNVDQTSDISALSDSEPGDISRIASIISSPRKRKREEQETDDDDTTERSLKKVSRKLADHIDDDEDEGEDREPIARDKEDEEDATDEEAATSKENTPDRDEITQTAAKEDDEASVADEAEAEGGEGEAEATAKGEEDAAKKDAALQELRAIEKDFALLRDKLFAEKSQQLNEELDILRNRPMSHNDFAVAAGAVARRRDEQKQQAITVFEYNVRNLQKVCVAERTMAHCQYMQEVQESRETALDEAGHEWYRIHRERRRAEDEEGDKRLHFNKDRPTQVASQQAYNREVSILSGIQKHVGFPAAPRLEGVSEADKAEDLKKMGISAKPVHNIPISAPISSFPRQQQPRADESFLERNPWANPAQVYGTQVLNLPQQASTGAPVSTPAGPKRQTEPQTQNSASTIAISSVEQTPMSNQVQHGSVHRPQIPQSDGPVETPSRNTGTSRPELAVTDASPANGNATKNSPNGGHGTTNGVNGLTVARAKDDSISPRSSPLKTTQVQTVSAGSS